MQGRCRLLQHCTLCAADTAGAGTGTDTATKTGVFLDGSPTPFRLTFSKYPCVLQAACINHLLCGTVRRSLQLVVEECSTA